MKEIVFKELGYFTQEQAERIASKLNSKSYLNFQVKYSNVHGNCTLILIVNEDEMSEQEIKNFFISCALCEI